MKQMPLWVVALISACLSVFGRVIYHLIEYVIIGVPVYRRAPVAGPWGWFVTCVFGVFLGIRVMRKGRRWLKALGLLAILLNVASILFMGCMVPSVVIRNPKVTIFRGIVVPKDKFDELVQEWQQQNGITNDWHRR